MSLLGFAAYFSAVSMKINTKSYRISVLRQAILMENQEKRL
jgi:hypothetical protein